MSRAMQGELIILSFLIISLFPALQLAAQEGPGRLMQGEVFAARPAMREVTLTGYTRARHVMDIACL